MVRRTLEGIMDPTTTADASRSTVACQKCKRRKVKCSGIKPCRNCQRSGSECIFEDIIKRKNYPEAYVNQLIETVAEQATQIKEYEKVLAGEHITSNGRGELQFILDGQHVLPSPSISSTTHTRSATVNVVSEPASSSTVDELARESGYLRMPNQAFTNQVSQVLNIPNSRHRRKRRREQQSEKSYSNVAWSSPKILERGLIELPDEDQAYRLQEVLSSTISDAYFLIDHRQFADSIATIYESHDEGRLPAGLEFIRSLLVLSLGQLLFLDTGSSQGPPGIDYFLKARDLFPDIATLRQEPTLAIEVLCLIALYLHCCDQREDAYIYIGLAVRLSITEGLCTECPRDEIPRSQMIYRNRLWWSLYILDRRISSSVGGAFGIADQEILLQTPSDFPGFDSSSALNINIRIAQSLGHVMCSLYNPERTTREPIIAEIQKILNCLHASEKLIALEHPFEWSQENAQVTRTGATLYLTLYQTIILAIRPILFHLLKRKIRWVQGTAPAPSKCPDDLTRLVDICRDSATKLVRILQTMRRQNMISVYLFTDLDAAFSAAVVFLMEGTVSPTARTVITPGVIESCQIMQSMAEAGNEAAARRGKDIEHLYTSIESALGALCPHRFRERHLDGSARVVIEPRAQRQQSCESLNEASANPSNSQQFHQQACAEILPNNSQVPTVAGYPANNDGLDQTAFATDEFFPLTLDPQSLNMQNTDLHGMYYDPDLMLTGIDSSDWMELERLIEGFQGSS